MLSTMLPALVAARVGRGPRWLLCLCVIWLGACAAAGAQQPELPEGPNRDLVLRECGACHDMTMVVGEAGSTRDEWKTLINEMINNYGADIAPGDQAKILDYLATALGPGKSPR
jgi:hypothetical protein